MTLLFARYSRRSHTTPKHLIQIRRQMPSPAFISYAREEPGFVLLHSAHLRALKGVACSLRRASQRRRDTSAREPAPQPAGRVPDRAAPIRAASGSA
jgi:hypothetical protein